MKLQGAVVVETGGIGYEIQVPDNSEVYLKREGEEVVLFTTMVVRDDNVTLYGFHTSEAMELFGLLRTVSGVGAKAALAIISAMPLNDLRQAIAFEDAKMIQRANGVGKKTAERVVLELKEKVGPLENEAAIPSGIPDGLKDKREEAVNALIALGYSRNEAVSAVADIREKELSVEDYIKQALKGLF